MNDSYRRIIGARIKSARQNRKLSQEDLAEGVCSRQTISLLENGQHLPSTEFLKKISDKLEIPFHEMLGVEIQEFEAKIQLDILKIYVETEDYASASSLIEQLELREDLLEYQRRELMLFHAECLMRTKRVDQAIQMLTDMKLRLELEHEPNDHLSAILYNKLGSAYYLNSDIVKAYSTYQQAYQISHRFPFNVTSADIVFNLGMICSLMRRKEEALTFYEIAQQYYVEISDNRRLADTLFNKALIYRHLNDLSSAEQCLQQALALFASLNMPQMANIVKMELAYSILSAIDPDQAVVDLLKCAETFERYGDTQRAVYTYTRLAKLLIGYKRYDESKKYLLLALSKFTDDESFKLPRFAFLYQIFGDYFLQIQEFDKSIEYLIKSTTLFNKMGLLNDAAESLQLSAKAYEELQEIYRKLASSS